jgi:predicted Rossmann fold flavoprotein
MNKQYNTELIIIGAGAAGLMAAATATELGLRAVLIERKHQPGRKLLMCGNNRCNISNDLPWAKLQDAYGEPVGPFLGPAFARFTPDDLRDWCHQHGMRTVVHKDSRIFPRSENADDVLHLFTDILRDRSFPVIFNSPATAITRAESGGFDIACQHLSLTSRFVLLATGGVSYPKTGSVGDGQKFAKALGHRVVPYRPGLAGIELRETWLHTRPDVEFPGASLTILHRGRKIAETQGGILCTSRGARGSAMVDASRIMARRNLRASECRLVVDLWPQMSVRELSSEIEQQFRRQTGKPVAQIIGGWLVPKGVCQSFLMHAAGVQGAHQVDAADTALATRLAQLLKNWQMQPTGVRPLKEAMVTVGGIDLADIDANSMQSQRCPGLFFAGEVMDIDGPTGGFNLHAAFATARLAVHSMSKAGKK